VLLWRIAPNVCSFCVIWRAEIGGSYSYDLVRMACFRRIDTLYLKASSTGRSIVKECCAECRCFQAIPLLE